MRTTIEGATDFYASLTAFKSKDMLNMFRGRRNAAFRRFETKMN